MTKKIKNFKASILIVTMMILGIVLTSSLSIAIVSLKERKASLGSNKSNQAYQTADTGIEKLMDAILTNRTVSTKTGNDLGLPCSGGKVTGAGFVVELKKDDPANPGNEIVAVCTDTLDKIVAIKSVGTGSDMQRSIETAVAPGCGGKLIDVEGNEYGTVQIGSQCWMKESLQTTKYPNGTSIVRGPTAPTWDGSDNGYYAYPSNLAGTAEETLTNIKNNKLGFLYQWSAAMNGSTVEGAQGVCPDSWHLPTDGEYKTLEMELGMTQLEADKISAWRGVNEGSKLSTETLNGNNSSGFTALLSGSRLQNGNFWERGVEVYFWTSSPRLASSTWFRSLSSNRVKIFRDSSGRGYGTSVRCIKD
ncbi:MAG: fibrobacter succinogenes major paralogous domain-containing protein [Candidatus Moranbacteria bacterium]|nr:fibrobacter succinogenes major paralogous domain-containing protein [Candidatus Moranbacteria bacterium]